MKVIQKVPQFGTMVIGVLSLLSIRMTVANRTDISAFGESWQNYGFYCEKNPNCICSGTRSDYSIFCEGVVEISVVQDSGLVGINVGCRDNAREDVFESLGLLPNKSLGSGIDMTIRECPVPSSGYSVLAKIISKKGDDDATNLLTSLSILCKSSRDFNLEKRHFLLLNSLEKLKIQCSGLSRINSDLLTGLPVDVKYIEIEKTSLTSFSKDLISRFTNLNELNLSENRVKKFADDFFKVFGNLTSLNLSDNKLTFLAEDIFQHNIRFTELDISKNSLKRLPNSICSLNKLTQLLLQDNKIVYVQAGCFFKMDSLQVLDLSDNQLKSLDYRDASWTGKIIIASSLSENQGGTSLQKIDPSKFPKIVSASFSLQSNPGVLFSRKTSVLGMHGFRILLRNNSLESVPENFFYGFRKLRDVDLSLNKLSVLPPKLFYYNRILNSLDLSGNDLTHFPEGFLSANLKLQNLNISCNRIKTLDVHFLLGLNNLISLDLSHNAIESLPREIFKAMNQTVGRGFVQFINAFTLNLEGNRLLELPLLALPRLKVISLSRNRLTNLCSDAFRDLSFLERLNASHNFIRGAGCGAEEVTGIAFPPFLIRLLEVDLSHNKLTLAPAIHDVYGHLRTLDLSGNDIGSFPSTCSPALNAIGRSALQHVDLSNNGLTWADHCGHQLGKLSYLINVKTLDFSRNRIRLECSPEVDHSLVIWGCSTDFKSLKNVEEINLAHNEIDFLPMEFRHHLPKLRLVDLRYNRIKIIWYQDFLVTNGLSHEILESLRYSENDFIRRNHRDGGFYYEYPNSHQLKIDLRHNHIHAVDLPDDKVMAIKNDCHVEKQFASVSLLLGYNPITCNCQVFRLLRYAQKELRPVSENERKEGFRLIMPAKIDIEGLRCSDPPTVLDKAILDPETWAHHLLPLVGICHQQTSNLTL